MESGRNKIQTSWAKWRKQQHQSAQYFPSQTRTASGSNFVTRVKSVENNNMTSLQGYLPPPGSSNWHRAHSNSTDSNDTSAIRHVIIREVWSEKRPKPHAVYKIEVMSHSSHWFVFRRYNEFYNLHQQMVKRFGVPRDFLPPKKLTNSMAIHTLEIRREALEHYLQRLINSCDREISSCPDLLEFLDLKGHDVSLVAVSLARYLRKNGDRILAKNDLFPMTPVQLYCITKQLQLPHPQKNGDVIDLAHLYDFVSQLRRLSITDFVSKASNGKQFEVNYRYDLSLFSKLQELHVDGCNVPSIAGISSLPQRLTSLSVRHCINTMKEFLVDFAAEKRPAPAVKDLKDSWRTQATYRLSNKRVIVQPWVSLQTLNLSHNNIISLDSSINVLPALQELDLSFNKMAHLDLSFLEESHLQKLLLIGNEIYLISGSCKTLNNLKILNLSQNRIQSMEGLLCAQGLIDLDLSNNLVVVLSEVRKLAALENLKKLSVNGNPLTKKKRHRINIIASFRHKEIELDGQPMTKKERAKLDAKFGSDKEVDFDDDMSISTISEDDLDSGIDGHVPSLGPLFEEEDLIVMDRDSAWNMSKFYDRNESLSRIDNAGEHNAVSTLEGRVPKDVQWPTKTEEEENPRQQRFESFDDYQESLAANWKQDSRVSIGTRKESYPRHFSQASRNRRGYVGDNTNTTFNTNNEERNLQTDTRKRTNIGNTTCSRNGNENEIDRNATEHLATKRDAKAASTVVRDPSITSFDKLMSQYQTFKLKKQKKPRQFKYLESPNIIPDDNDEDQEKQLRRSNVAGSSFSGNLNPDITSEELQQHSAAILGSGNPNVVILPEIDELQIHENDEDELWIGEDECEAAEECDESPQDHLDQI